MTKKINEHFASYLPQMPISHSGRPPPRSAVSYTPYTPLPHDCRHQDGRDDTTRVSGVPHCFRAVTNHLVTERKAHRVQVSSERNYIAADHSVLCVARPWLQRRHEMVRDGREHWGYSLQLLLGGHQPFGDRNKGTSTCECFICNGVTKWFVTAESIGDTPCNFFWAVTNHLVTETRPPRHANASSATASRSGS